MSEGGRFVVLRRNCRRAKDGWLLLPGQAVVAVCASAEEAEALRRRHEDEARAVIVNPFRCGPTLRYLTSYPLPVLRDWLHDAGLEPPAEDDLLAWEEWWDGHSDRFTGDQRERVWAGLDRVWTYEVHERPAARTAYAVVRVMWEYNDNWFEPGEGGETVRAFRRWDDAEAYRQLLQEQARAKEVEMASDRGDDYYRRHEVTRWRVGPFDREDREGNFVPGPEATFYEVVEVELEGGA